MPLDSCLGSLVHSSCIYTQGFPGCSGGDWWLCPVYTPPGGTGTALGITPQDHPAASPPWAAQQVGSRSQGCCRGHQLQAAAHAEGSSFPHPWPRVLRASARALHEVLRAGGAGCRAAGGSLSVLFTVYHVLQWKRNTRLWFGKGKKQVQVQTQLRHQ